MLLVKHLRPDPDQHWGTPALLVAVPLAFFVFVSYVASTHPWDTNGNEGIPAHSSNCQVSRTMHTDGKFPIRARLTQHLTMLPLCHWYVQHQRLLRETGAQCPPMTLLCLARGARLPKHLDM
jgi:hypothetical protein